MKRLRILATVALGMLCTRVGAVNAFKWNGLMWLFSGSDDGKSWHVKLASGNTSPAISPRPTGTSFTVPEKLDYYTVAQLGPYAFAKCSGLKQVTLPSTLWGMCDRAFWGCTAMTEMTVPTTVSTLDGAVFDGCGSPFSLRFSSWDHWQRVSCDAGTYENGLLSAPADITLYVEGKAVTRLEDLPASVRNIPDGAFRDYARFTFTGIPSQVTNVGMRAFANCDSVTSLVLSRGDLHFGKKVFSGSTLRDIRFADAALEVSDGICDGCAQLTNVTFASAVTNIGSAAFQDCCKLGEIVLPQSVGTLGDCAFMNCTNLGAIALPPKVVRVPGKAFYNDRALASVRLPQNLESIGSAAFENCVKLTEIDIPNTVTSIENRAFCGCHQLKSVTLPPKLKKVSRYAFESAYDLTSVSLPEGLTDIEYGAFSYARSLSSVEIPSTVTNVGTYAFRLTTFPELTFPSNVTAIGDGVFYNSRVLTVRMTGPRPSASKIFAKARTDLVTLIENYDPSWDSALEAGTWCDRKIVCSNDWTVTFELGDKGERTGGGALTQTVRTGNAATAPTVVSTDEDYVFAGWDKALDNIPFRCTINAVYEPRPLAAKGSSELSIRRFDDGAAVPLAAYGGVKPYVWTVVSGLPEGMTVSTNGVISGNTAFLGTTTVKVKVTDARGVSETLSYTLTVEESTDAKPVLDVRLPESDSVVVAHGRERTFSVAAHDPEGGPLRYRWFVDGDERTEATNSVFAYRDPDGSVTNREIRCVIEDSVWKLGYATETVWSVQTLFAPEIVSAEGELFASGAGQVSVTCNLAAAELFVAVGFAPRILDKFRYTAPVTLDKSATVWAVARCGDQITSYVSRQFTVATPALADPVGAGPAVQFTTGGDADWTPDGPSLRSGAVEPEGESWLEATFAGAGTFRFCWKTDCERDTDGECSWDALEVFADGASERYDAIDGTGDWEEVAIRFSGEGSHTLRWRFVRDDYDEPDATYANCGWISAVSWNDTPLPELGDDATAAKVAETLAAAADTRLRANVTTAARYARFRTWALGVCDREGIGADGVVGHAHSWPSFALGLDTLLERELTDGDLAVRTFAPTGSDGGFALTASVGDVSVGSDAAPEDLATLFGVSGSTSLDPTQFSSGNVSVTFGTPVDGNLSLTVAPIGSPPSFFMKLGVK